MLSLSTCWNSHRHTDGRDLAREAREMGFGWIEISHGTKITLLPGLLDAVEAGEIRVSSLHNFCPAPVEVVIDAPDVFEITAKQPWERERWLTLTVKTIEMAARFGADRVVVHLGSIPMKSITKELEAMAADGELYSRAYSDRKLKLVAARDEASGAHMERIRTALGELVPECQKHEVRLGIETRSHYEQIPNQREMRLLMEEFKNSPWIGAWHDFGHVQRQANLALLDHRQYLAETAPHLIGCHVHDVQWPARDHRVPMSTSGVDLAGLLPLVPAGTPMVWEVSPRWKADEVRTALTEWRARFPIFG
jgi:sugar phosphate isomerase/epimerase